MNRKRRAVLKTAGVAVVAPGIAKAHPLLGEAARDSMIKANLDAVAAHFHNESVNEVEKECELYTADIVWEAPARNLLFKDKKDVVDNYKKMFASMKDVKIRNLQIVNDGHTDVLLYEVTE